MSGSINTYFHCKTFIIWYLCIACTDWWVNFLKHPNCSDIQWYVWVYIYNTFIHRKHLITINAFIQIYIAIFQNQISISCRSSFEKLEHIYIYIWRYMYIPYLLYNGENSVHNIQVRSIIFMTILGTYPLLLLPYELLITAVVQGNKTLIDVLSTVWRRHPGLNKSKIRYHFISLTDLINCLWREASMSNYIPHKILNVITNP